MRGELDGVWTSDVFDVEIQGNIGKLVRFYPVAANIPQIGDTIISDLIKISKDNFVGLRIFLDKENEEFGIEPLVSWGIADFKIQEKDSERIMTSIIAGKDTIYFYK